MKTLFRVYLIVIVLLLTMAAGCTGPVSPAASTSQPPASGTVTTPETPRTPNPAVVITYTSSFTLEPAAGNILLVEVTIENKGYASFDTSPERFSVMVSNGEYTCDRARSTLPAISLQDGGRAVGSLAFKVPAGTASNRVDYRLVYTGDRLYNVWWMRASGAAEPDTPDTPSPNPLILIKYAPAFVLRDAANYLVMNISLENKGYDSFNTSPEYFSVVVSNERFLHDPTASDLRAFDIPNGGKINGKLAFKVPAGTGKAGYKPVYSGTRLYNILWAEVN